jgi:subfamily B ATP-binding cassette protein MsbA
MHELRTIRNLLPLLRLHRRGFPALMVLGLLQSLSEGVGIGLFLPLLDVLMGRGQSGPGGHWLAGVMNGLFRGVAPGHRLTAIVLCLFAAVVTTALLAYLHGILFAWLDGAIGHHLRAGIFAQLLAVNFGFIEQDRSGRLLNVLGTDTWRTSEALKMLVRMVVIASTIAVYVALLLLMSWRLTLLVGAILVLISMVVRTITNGVRGFGERATRLNAGLGDLMVEGLEGMRVIRAFGRERYEQQRFDTCSNRVRLAFLRMHLLEEAVHPLHDFLAGVLLLVILFTSARAGVDLSALLVFAFVLYRVQPRVKEFDASRVRLSALAQSVEEVRLLLDTADKRYLVSGRLVQPALRHGIVFDRVSFRYENAGAPALREASFTIPAGRTTALVGLSGGGKSTVIKLILRFEDPSAGSILVDGRPLPDVDLESWRSQLACVGQDVYLFNATVRAPRRLVRRHRRSRPSGRCPRVHRAHAAGIRHGARAARRAPLGRPAAADLPGPRNHLQSPRPHSRRSDQRARQHFGTVDPGHAREAARGANRDHDCPPLLDHRARRPHHRSRRRAGGGAGRLVGPDRGRWSVRQAVPSAASSVTGPAWLTTPEAAARLA